MIGWRGYVREPKKGVWVWRGAKKRKGWVVTQHPITGLITVFGRDGRIIYQFRTRKAFTDRDAENLVDDLMSGGKLGADMAKSGGEEHDDSKV